jgi:hypothetical protein
MERTADAHARLAHGDRANAGHDLALGQATVAHDAPMAIPGLEIGMSGQKLGDFGFDRLGQQGARPIAQDLGQMVGEDPWLNQLDDVIVDTAYHSFDEEVEARTPPRYAALPIHAVTNF